MRSIFLTFFSLIVLSSCATKESTNTPEESNLPNIIIIYADDLGYGDLACYGHDKHRTPHLDKMAAEGAKFMDFYSASGVCTPSRASLMTGCYPRRVDLDVNARHVDSVGRQVLFPKAIKGLNPSEITIAELCKQKGYATACIGKWHLGDQNVFLPTKHGFDYFYGIPYSNDMNRDFCPLPLMIDEKVIEAPVDQNTITRRYTEEVVKFINENKGQPFFIYLPHAMTHNPLHAGDAFRGKSTNGIYGDAVEEIDWSTGEILKTLKENGIDGNTLVMFSSDNGAAKKWGGSNGVLSGWKGSTFEGGQRVPCIMRWPDKIPAGIQPKVLASTMDIFPTISKVLGLELPKDRIIDGYDIAEIMEGKTDRSPTEAFFYYQKEQLKAVRAGKWKLHLPLEKTYASIHWPGYKEGRKLSLYNLEDDIAESIDVSKQHPEIVDKLLGYSKQMQDDLGDMDIPPTNQRKAGYVENPIVQLMD